MRLFRTFINLIDKAHLSTKLNLSAEMSKPMVYQSLESVMSVLHNEKFTNNEGVRQLLSVYDEYCTGSSPEGKKHPLIVIEGLDATGKTTVIGKLAKIIGAQILTTPPKCVSHIRELFEDDFVLRTAYYSLGNYIAAVQISSALTTQPVVLDRFWHSTAAYALAEAVRSNIVDDLPLSGEKIYQWPSDLLKPDIVLGLVVTEEERQRRHSSRNTTNTNQEQRLKSNSSFRTNIFTAYKSMVNPSIHVVAADGGVEEIVEEISERTKYLFR